MPTPKPTIDHRRAIADRNATAILDATEQLVADGATLSMASVASAAGVSRPTLYAHYSNLSEVVEAALTRSVNAALVAFEEARPAEGAAEEALMRMLDASWGRLSRQDALARVASEHLKPQRQFALHAPLVAHMMDLVKRGQADGTFRTDLPADWLVRMFYAVVHAGDEHARSSRSSRGDALEMLRTTVKDLLIASKSD